MDPSSLLSHFLLLAINKILINDNTKLKSTLGLAAQNNNLFMCNTNRNINTNLIKRLSHLPQESLTDLKNKTVSLGHRTLFLEIKSQ